MFIQDKLNENLEYPHLLFITYNKIQKINFLIISQLVFSNNSNFLNSKKNNEHF